MLMASVTVMRAAFGNVVTFIIVVMCNESPSILENKLQLTKKIKRHTREYHRILIKI